jgi:hypothetical protein
MDWKEFGDHIYGATDFDVNNLDIIVITLDSAIELRQIGVLVYLVWMDGPVREDRNRKANVDNGPDLMKEVDSIMTNDGSIEELAERLRLTHSSLKMVCDAVLN